MPKHKGGDEGQKGPPSKVSKGKGASKAGKGKLPAESQLAMVPRAVVSGGASADAVSFSGDRPPSVAGKQVDHSSAYALFKQIVVTAVLDKPLEDGLKAMLTIISSYASNEVAQEVAEAIKARLAEFNEEPDGVIWSELAQKGVDAKTIDQIKARFEVAKRLFLLNALGDIISKHLELRNKLELTTFPPDGLSIKPPADEATRVKAALTFLRSLDSPADVSANKARIAEKIFDLIWYPKVPEDDLKTLTDPDFRTRVIAEKRYNKNTLLRDNRRETLIKVLTNHLELVIDCFPVLAENDGDTVEIIDLFLHKMLSSDSDYEHAWGVDKDTFGRLSGQIKNEVSKRLDIRGLDSRSETPSSTEESASTESSSGASGDASRGSGTSSQDPDYSNPERPSKRSRGPGLPDEGGSSGDGSTDGSPHGMGT